MPRGRKSVSKAPEQPTPSAPAPAASTPPNDGTAADSAPDNDASAEYNERSAPSSGLALVPMDTPAETTLPLLNANEEDVQMRDESTSAAPSTSLPPPSSNLPASTTGTEVAPVMETETKSEEAADDAKLQQELAKYSQEEIAEWRTTQIDKRQLQLTAIVDQHDDHVRELFHLDRFVTLIGFDPVVAKEDKSDVFLSFQHRFDLFTHATPDTSGSGTGRRATRRAANERKELAIHTEPTPPPVASTSTAIAGPSKGKKVDAKGKAKAEDTGVHSSDADIIVAVKKKAGRKSAPLPPPSTTPATATKGKGKARHSIATLRNEPTPSTSHLKHSLASSSSPASSKRLKVAHGDDKYDGPIWTHPLQIPRPPTYGGSLSALLSSYLALDDEGDPTKVVDPATLEARAEHEATILNKVALLRASGRTLGNPDRRTSNEPKRAKDHQENLLDHVIFFSKLVHDERKSHIALAKKTGRLVLGHFDRLKGKSEREQKEEERAQKNLARWTMKEVKKKWTLAVKVVKARRKAIIKAEQERLGKQQLHAMLDKSTTMLQAQQIEMAAEESESESSSSDESSEEEEEDEEEKDEDEGQENETEDGNLDDSSAGVEETPEVEGPSSPIPVVNGRRRPLRSRSGLSASSTPFDIAKSPLVSNGNDVSMEEGDVPAEEDGDDQVFEAPEDEERANEDQNFEIEMEEEDQGGDSDSELDGLAEDADLPIEEIMRRAGYGAMLDEQAQEDSAEITSEAVAPAASTSVATSPRDSPAVQTEDDAEAEAEAMSEFSSAADEERENEDEQLEEEMEAEDEESENEDAELLEDAELSIEELRRKYGVGEAANGITEEEPKTNGVLVNGHHTSEVEETEEVSEQDGSEVAGSEEHGSEDEEDGEDVSEDEEEEEEEDEEMDGVVSGPNLKPPFLLRGSLRPYQQAGLEWLASLYTSGVNGILADEMGLGKTIQTISLLAHLACDKGQWGPHLVVVPTSVMLNWEMEFKKFLPGFKILTYYGTQKERKEKRRGWNTENAFHVCVTSYQLVLADQHMFRRKPWHYMILDEAHHIKNFRSQRWQTLLGFNARHRLLLTGTPLQNNLMELWSLLYFLMPHGLMQDGKGPFADHADFQSWFSNPMEKAIENGEAMDEETKATVAKLHTVLRPYLLRRLKSEVETQMPGKTESIVYCRLSKRQRFLYDDFMSRSQTRETLGSGHFLSIINCLMQLRKVCNHPDLFEVRPIVTSFAMSRSVASEYEPAELLVRRRLLEEEPMKKMDWSTLTLVKPDQELMTSSIAASCLLDLDAAEDLPSLRTPNPNVDLAVEPPKDTTTLAGWRNYYAWSQEKAMSDRLRSMAGANTRRCEGSVPFFGHELLHLLRSPSREHTILPADVPRPPSPPFAHSDILPTLVKSLAARAEQLDESVAHFGFVTPKVKAADMPRHALSGLTLAEAQTIEEEAPVDLLQRASVKLSVAFPDRSLLQYDCGKLQKLDELLRECKAGGHRVLIFTQMTKVLDILEIFLSFHGHRYLRLDGSTKIEERQIITERFNSNDKILCFISSTRSGGLGINLQGADTVIFYDSDWNPALDRQCQDRAHRIGQTREVRIWRFVTEHSIEENMLKKANQKRRLDEMVIADGDFTTDYLQKLDWRDYLDDSQLKELGVDEEDGPPAESAADIRQALAAAEDEEDAAAAKAAEGELQVDQSDFNENAPVPAPAVSGIASGGEGSGSATPGADTPMEVPMDVAEEEDVDPLAGTVDGYIVHFIEENWELFA